MPRTSSPPDRLALILADDLARVSALMGERMLSDNAPRIPQVSAHLFGGGGKRLRPMLTLAAAHLLGKPGETACKLAAAVEFIHTATLLHDDVVDKSETRRGRATANILWDNKSSILTGDYLFARSFQLMVETGSMRVLDLLANASATIAEGEVLQLTAANDPATTEAIYDAVIRGKTAALFSAACAAGAVVSGGSEAAISALFTYGDALGMAFQMSDDALDYFGTAETGKAIGGDFREGKMTYPVILALAGAKGEERTFWERVIRTPSADPADLETALAYLQACEADAKTRTRARHEANRAKAALAALPAGEVTDILAELADFVVARSA